MTRTIIIAVVSAAAGVIAPKLLDRLHNPNQVRLSVNITDEDDGYDELFQVTIKASSAALKRDLVASHVNMYHQLYQQSRQLIKIR